MDRRAALSALAAAALAPSALARGRDRVRTIGYLSGGAGTEEIARLLAALGHVEGRNLRFFLRKPKEDDSDLDALAAELVGERPDVLLAWGYERVAALHAATRSIPIVCGLHPDPVRAGLARSVARPGGNVTGLSSALTEIIHLRVAMLRALRPRLQRVTLVHQPDYRGLAQFAAPLLEQLEREGVAARQRTGRTAADLEEILSSLGDPEREAVDYFSFRGLSDPRVPGRLMLRHRVVAHSNDRQVVEHGALFYCRLMWTETRRMERTAEILDKVLRGTPPAEIPIELPDRLDFLLNRRVAATLGVKIPPEVLLRASEVIG